MPSGSSSATGAPTSSAALPRVRSQEARGCRSVWVGLQVVAVALEVEAAELGLGLSEQVALAEEDLVVEPSQRLVFASVAPPHDGAAGSVTLSGGKTVVPGGASTVIVCVAVPTAPSWSVARSVTVNEPGTTGVTL